MQYYYIILGEALKILWKKYLYQENIDFRYKVVKIYITNHKGFNIQTEVLKRKITAKQNKLTFEKYEIQRNTKYKIK